MMNPRNLWLSVILAAVACSLPPTAALENPPLTSTPESPLPTTAPSETPLPILEPSPIPILSPTPEIAPTLAIPPSAMRIPAGFTDVDLPGSGRLCADSFSRSAPEDAAIPVPLGILFQRDYEDENQPGFSTGRGIPYLGASEPGELKSLVCILERRTQVGTYQPQSAIPGSKPEPAYQLVWKVRVVSWPAGEILAGADLSGENPLQAILSNEARTGGNYGTPPEKDLLSWLFTSARDQALFYNTWNAARQPEGGLWALVREAPGGDLSGRVEIWDLQNGVMQQELKTPAFVYGLAYQPGGSALVVLMQTNVGLLDISTGSFVKTYQPLEAEPSPLMAGGIYQNLALSLDGKWVAFSSMPIFSPGGSGMDIILWEPGTGQERQISSGLERIDHLAFAGNGKLLAASGCDTIGSACDRYSLRAWQVDSGELMSDASGSRDTLLFDGLPDETWVVSLFCESLAERTSIPLCGDWRLHWLDTSTGELLDELDTQMDAVSALAISPDGRRLAVGRTWPAVIELWDLGEKRVAAYLGGGGVDLDQLVFSTDGRLLLALGNGFMKVWEVP